MKNLFFVLSVLIAFPLSAQFSANRVSAQPGPQDQRKRPPKIPVVKTLPTPEKPTIGELADGVDIRTPVVYLRKILTVYDRDDFSGVSKSFSAGVYNSIRLGEFDNKISSISLLVSEGFSVNLCDNDQTQTGGGEDAGYCRRIEYIPTVGNPLRDSLSSLNLDNKVSYLSIEPIEPSLIVYNYVNQKGKAKKFWIGGVSGNTNSFLFFNGDELENTISSVKVRSGYRATLCKNTGDRPPSANCETLEAGSHNVKFSNVHSKIIIVKL